MPTAAPTRALTREELVRLGQSGRAWEFLAVAARGLASAPGDHALRFLVSANLARLGLKTLAVEQLNELPADAQGHPDVAALRGAVATLPEDRVNASALRQNLLHNAAALRERAIEVSGSASVESAAVFKALDGNVLVRGAGCALSTCGFADRAGAAANFVRNDPGLSKPACVILAGLCPWMLRRVYEATPSQPLGFRQPILVVEPDASVLHEALALADLSDVLRDERVQLFTGSDAARQLEQHLLGRIDYQMSSLLVPASPAAVTQVTPVIERALGAQEIEFQRLRTRVEAIYAGRGEAWWARRYRAAAAGGPPLRVLIPTCRYSTFIKHSSADLCATLRRQGHEAELYLEPDDQSKLCGVGYLRTFERFQPDLVILINFPRSSMGESMPRNVPFVCWVQDAMPHLFDAATGAAQGPLDFLIGHTFIELFQKYGYPTLRALPISVVADDAKFYPKPSEGPAEPEAAFVSHQSETPVAMHERLCRESAQAPAIVRTLELLYGDVEYIVGQAAAVPATLHLQRAVMARLREVFGSEPEQRVQTLVMRQYATPMADRMLRHQTLEWAAAIVRRRGWRLGIYGRGWDRHPTLSEFARPELEHGGALRDCYQSAAAHLHVAASTLTHQRVVECYLSGGLCLCRLHRDAISSARMNTQMALLQRAPDVVDDENEQIGYTIADHPEAMSLAAVLASVGYPYEGPVLWIPKARALSHRRLGSVLAPDQDPAFLLGDLAETTFSDEAELEWLLNRAVDSPPWRSAVSAMVARRARAHLTHDALVRRMLNLVGGSLGALALKEAV